VVESRRVQILTRFNIRNRHEQQGILRKQLQRLPGVIKPLLIFAEIKAATGGDFISLRKKRGLRIPREKRLGARAHLPWRGLPEELQEGRAL
jgi:hypothetical protein